MIYMWWLYVEVFESAEHIIYCYSTESEDLDGVIVYDKKTEEWKVTCPCKADQGNEWCVFKSEEKFRHVVEEGFPDRRRVVIG